MISEQAIIEHLILETFESAVWTEWTGSLRNVEINRGGRQNGVTTSVQLGTLTATLVNAGDPLTDSSLKPNLPVRVRKTLSDDPIFTGSLLDLDSQYQLDKRTGKMATFVNLFAIDAFASHAAITVLGAVTSGGAGYESWANRIARLAADATADIDLPADDAPIVRYAL